MHVLAPPQGLLCFSMLLLIARFPMLFLCSPRGFSSIALPSTRIGARLPSSGQIFCRCQHCELYALKRAEIGSHYSMPVDGQAWRAHKCMIFHYADGVRTMATSLSIEVWVFSCCGMILFSNRLKKLEGFMKKILDMKGHWATYFRKHHR